jgi:hypothetical protein
VEYPENPGGNTTGDKAILRMASDCKMSIAQILLRGEDLLDLPSRAWDA